MINRQILDDLRFDSRFLFSSYGILSIRNNKKRLQQQQQQKITDF